MKIHKPKKISLWQRFNFKLLGWSQFIMFHPSMLFYVLVGGLCVGLVLFSWLGYVFTNLAFIHTGYWFGVGVMGVLDYFIIMSFFKLKTFRHQFSGFNIDSMNQMMYGDIANPIIDKIKGKRE